jgi:hypothetical protein
MPYFVHSLYFNYNISNSNYYDIYYYLSIFSNYFLYDLLCNLLLKVKQNNTPYSVK